MTRFAVFKDGPGHEEGTRMLKAHKWVAGIQQDLLKLTCHPEGKCG